MLSEWTQKCQSKRAKKNESIADLLEPALAVAPDKVAIHFEGRAITYRELDASINKVASGLVEFGIQPGDRVSIHVDNRPEFISIFLGVMRAGGVLVPTNVMYTGEEMEHILNDSGARLLFILGPLAEKMKKVNAPTVEQIIELGPQALDHSVAFEPFLERASGERPRPEIDPAKAAIIQYTSGTTGQPKGAMVSHDNVLAVLDSTLDLPGGIDGIEEDVALLVLPLFHAYALDLGITRTFQAVQTMVLVSRFDAELLFSLFEKHKVTVFLGAPPMYFAFVNTPGLGKYDVSSLRLAGSGAAPLPVIIMEKFEELTGVQINEGYGLSETAPTLSTNMAGPVNKLGSVGPPIKNVKVRIVDEEDNDVPQGEVGEIIAQGPNIFIGYWNNEVETAEAMRGGWFHTGDMGRFDEDGYIYIVDRMKDMIVVSGFNVYPIEVENVILRHPKVVDCAVIGVASEYQGESVKAVIVLKEGEAMDQAELEEYCREKLAAFKVPKSLSIREALPKNPTGKVLKRVIREEEGGITKAVT